MNKQSGLHVMSSTAVWMSWSALVVLLYALDLGFSFAQLFGLLALSGFAAAAFQLVFFFLGDRALQPSFIRLTSGLLILPCVLMIGLFSQPNLDYTLLQLLAIACGLGGAQLFLRSMHGLDDTQTSGWDLAVTASVGGLGILVAQILTPLLAIVPNFLGASVATFTTDISTGTVLGGLRPGAVLTLANIGIFFAGLVLVAIIRRPLSQCESTPLSTPTTIRRALLRNPHTWLMTVLYIMSFGTFVGLALSFPLVLKFIFGVSRHWQEGQLLAVLSNDYAPQALTYAWLGPLIGVVVRPLGGWLADQYGGAKVTLACAGALTLVSLAAAWVTRSAYLSSAPEAYFLLFLLIFFALFAAASIASSAICRSASVLFPAHQLPSALRWLSACAIAGAGYMPLMWGVHSVTGTPDLAFIAFAGFYGLCGLLVVSVYLRRHSVYFNP
ncbi:MFS transporter [Pseudidiomarina sp. YC-516-91]|uniref:MFS transporter n=1 Tax=Pseudidiomarina salilacus TaxID=3384452 RepID=UPI003984783A